MIHWLDKDDKQTRHGYIPKSNLRYWCSSKQDIRTAKIDHFCVEATHAETLRSPHQNRHQWLHRLKIIVSLSSNFKKWIPLIAAHCWIISNLPSPSSWSYPSSSLPSSSRPDCRHVLKQSHMYIISSLLLICLCTRLISAHQFPFHFASSSNTYCSCGSTHLRICRYETDGGPIFNLFLNHDNWQQRFSETKTTNLP